jgi:hypothetical protein
MAARCGGAAISTAAANKKIGEVFELIYYKSFGATLHLRYIYPIDESHRKERTQHPP